MTNRELVAALWVAFIVLVVIGYWTIPTVPGMP